MFDVKLMALPSRLPSFPSSLEDVKSLLPQNIEWNARTILATVVTIYGSSLLIRALLPSTRRHDSVPSVTGALPILGHAAAFEQDSVTFLKSQFQKLGDAVSINLLGWNVSILTSKYTKEYFGAADQKLSFDEAAKESLVLDVTLGLGGEFLDVGGSLALLETLGTHRTFLTAITNPFHVTALKERFNPLLPQKHQMVYDAMEQFIENTISKDMVGKPADSPVVVKDLRHWAWGIVAKSSARCFVGEKLSNNPDLIDIFISYNGVINTAMRQYRLLPTFLRPMSKYFIGRPIRKQEERLRAIIFPEILERQRRKRELGERYEAPDDMLEFLIESRLPDGTPQNNEEILGRIFALIFASMITTTFRTWQLLYDVAGNPSIEKQLYEEQQAVIEKHGTAFTKEAVADMKLMETCVRESLRLSVSVFASSRRAMQDVEFADGVKVPEGRMVFLAGYDIHRNPERYPDPDTFNPSHQAGKIATTPDRNFVLFGMGKHTCPGRFFAVLEMKAAIAALLRKYEFYVVKDDVSLERCDRPPHMPKPDEMYITEDRPIAFYARS
ncbi:hypothetical protein HDV00_006202 [Rhizophlyctis rosea]|nr:hypothetical protein HDV00_006202 [Rhizophlyctis rosea]